MSAARDGKGNCDRRVSISTPSELEAAMISHGVRLYAECELSKRKPKQGSMLFVSKCVCVCACW